MEVCKVVQTDWLDYQGGQPGSEKSLRTQVEQAESQVSLRISQTEMQSSGELVVDLDWLGEVYAGHRKLAESPYSGL